MISGERPDIRLIVEALLMCANEPLTAREIANILGADVSATEVELSIRQLNAEYDASGRAFAIKAIANGYQIMTLPQYAPWVKKMVSREKQRLLSKAALETLAIIAYRQPITKVEIEEIRGVQADGVLKALLDKDLIKVAGKKDVPGRPLLYVTTDTFLNYFCLKDISELPSLEEFRNMLGDAPDTEEHDMEVNLGIGEVQKTD